MITLQTLLDYFAKYEADRDAPIFLDVSDYTNSDAEYGFILSRVLEDIRND